MKKRSIIFSALVLFSLAFTTFNEPEKDIVGTWKIDEAYVEGVVKATIDAAGKINPEAAAQLEQNYPTVLQLTANTEFVYKADHTYETKVPGQPIRDGKWMLLDNGHSILLSPIGKPQRKDSIIELSPKRMKIINSERGDTTLFIKQ